MRHLGYGVIGVILIESALLGYELYMIVLKDIDFWINHYDMCVAN